MLSDNDCSDIDIGDLDGVIDEYLDAVQKEMYKTKVCAFTHITRVCFLGQFCNRIKTNISHRLILVSGLSGVQWVIIQVPLICSSHV